MAQANCEKHPFELAETACYDCGHDVCSDCLVFARGANKPAICLSCSFAAAGVRSSAAPQAKYDAKSMRILRKQLVTSMKDQQRAIKRAAREAPAPYDPRSAAVPAPSFVTEIAPAIEPMPAPASVPDPIPAAAEPEPSVNTFARDDEEPEAWRQSWSDSWDTPAFSPGNS